MDFEILEESPELTRIALKGALDTTGVDRIETRLNAILARGGHGVLDLSDVTFLTSLGIPHGKGGAQAAIDWLGAEVKA